MAKDSDISSGAIRRNKRPTPCPTLPIFLFFLASSAAVCPAGAFFGYARTEGRRGAASATAGALGRPLAVHGGTILPGERSASFLAASSDSGGEKDEKTEEKEAEASATAEAPKPAASSAASPAITSSTASASADSKVVASELSSRLLAEAREIGKCGSLLLGYITTSDDDVEAEDIVQLCDDLDGVQTGITDEERQLLVTQIDLRSRTLRAARYEMLNKLMRKDYDAYVATASFLSPSRIPRYELPNVQDLPYPDVPEEALATDIRSEEGLPLVADCGLEDKSFEDSPLDKLLLKIFRDLVEKNTGGVTSPKEGIEGLCEQGRTFMVQPGQTPEAQHKMVYDTLGGLMTPYLPPFYRIFMSGIVPKLGTDWDGKQIGPWFYAPWLTSVVTPTFFGFLVGPSRPNSRKDGRPGGLLVEKCKFLQESGCKGLCLHQCKLPAQQFFREELGLDLAVSPNFVTQECQWSFGEIPLPPEDDPSFPRGCLVGCESRKAMAGTYADALG